MERDLVFLIVSEPQAKLFCQVLAAEISVKSKHETVHFAMSICFIVFQLFGYSNRHVANFRRSHLQFNLCILQERSLSLDAFPIVAVSTWHVDGVALDGAEGGAVSIDEVTWEVFLDFVFLDLFFLDLVFLDFGFLDFGFLDLVFFSGHNVFLSLIN